jgi:DNA-binding NtrC family response regulator
VNTDVRVVAATNRSPAQSVNEGTLREDLYYRLNVFPINLPPLRDRRGDVALLAQYFLDQLNAAESTQKRFSTAALERVERHEWPGNVRELKNAVQRAYIMAESEIEPSSLPADLGAPAVTAASEPGGSSRRDRTSLSEAERHLILATPDHYDGDKKKTAEILASA